MTAEYRVAMELGRLIIQLAAKQSALDDLMAKVAELEKELAEARAKLT